MAVTVGLLALLILMGILEFRKHQRNLLSVPVRIHVNGTRGKSSVTRLIAAGMRAGGIRTLGPAGGYSPMTLTPASDPSPQNMGRGVGRLTRPGFSLLPMSRGKGQGWGMTPGVG